MSSLHDKRFPGESDEYREARDRLLEAELDLRDRTEQVAALRRQLPPGGRVEKDYVFEGFDAATGSVREVSFSELFEPGKNSLILYSYMFGPDWKKPCPMCTSIVDGYEGNAAYVRKRANLVVVAKAPVCKLKTWAKEREWSRVTLLSSEKNSFNADYTAEFPSGYGDQHPVLHVFVRRNGGVFHFWSSEMLYCRSEGDSRHVDSTWPLWNLLDLIPEGRGNWYPQFEK